MKRVKVGFLLLSNSWGGAEASISELITAIDRDRFEPYLLVNDFLVEHYASIEGVKIINLGCLESIHKLNKIYTIIKIRSRLLRLIEYHGIHLIQAKLENTAILLGLSRGRLKIPVVFTLCGDETKIYHRTRTLEHWLIRYFIDQMIRDHQIRVTAVSNWLIAGFRDQERSRIAVTPSGVDCAVFRPQPEVLSEPNVVLYAGRLVEGKGIQDLVAVSQRLPNYEFWFAGKGPLAKILDRPNLKYLGFKSRDELVDLYAHVTICAFPSYSEGLPLAGLEAMACGKAIVASYAGFSEYITHGENGVLIEPGDQNALYEWVIKLVQDHGLRRRIMINARQRAIEYEVTRAVSVYEDLYLGMISQR